MNGKKGSIPASEKAIGRRPSAAQDETAGMGTPRRKAAGVPVPPEERQRMVEEAAYYRAERRGFQGGSPEEDWLAAEAEIDTALTQRTMSRASDPGTSRRVPSAPGGVPNAGSPLRSTRTGSASDLRRR
jgi:DUF2934 family protein